jgi:hypothetical protein
MEETAGKIWRDRRITLRWILGKQVGRWMELTQNHIGQWALVLAVFSPWALLHSAMSQRRDAATGKMDITLNCLMVNCLRAFHVPYVKYASFGNTLLPLLQVVSV